MPKSGGEIPVPFAKELNDLVKRLVASAKEAGRAEALAQMRAIVGGASSRRLSAGIETGNPRRRRPAGRRFLTAAAPTKSRKKRKNPWAGLSPADRLARVNAIRKGRGLPLREKL